jgi:hypothetical protein
LGLCRLRHGSKKQKYSHQSERNHISATRHSAAGNFMLRHSKPPLFGDNGLMFRQNSAVHYALIAFVMLAITSKSVSRMRFPMLNNIVVNMFPVATKGINVPRRTVSRC